ncbi:MAG: ABC transporter related protein [Synergistales bacterium 54_24]|nr:MAG: ABC transporter related protein [Synergistales bacterium 54_24]HAF51132.1 ABC transporter ATP-binding protein [Synergistaceae bacterium]
MRPLLELKGITFSYPGGEPVLKGIDFRLDFGEKVGLWGHNGAGKTTLFHVIMGLERPSAGEILFEGRPVAGRKDLMALRRKVGFLFQDADDQLFCPTLLEDVTFGPLNLGLSSTEARDKAMATLDLLGIANLADRPPYSLSGGQKKLGAIATILAMDPIALILDEPTGGLDEDACALLERLLVATGTAILVASHDKAFIEKVAFKGYPLSDGRLLNLPRDGQQALPKGA